VLKGANGHGRPTGQTADLYGAKNDRFDILPQVILISAY